MLQVCRPPVVFGMSAFNSDKDATVVIFKSIAIAIASMNVTPNVPEPSPNETRQLVATTRPTDIDTTFASPNFFLFISKSFLL